jgi:hypothetical protein
MPPTALPADDARHMASKQQTQPTQRPNVPLANEASYHAPAPPPAPRQSFEDWWRNAAKLGSIVGTAFIIIWKLFSIDATVKETFRRSWTIADQREYMRRVEKANPTIILPDIMDVIHARTPQPAPH